MAKFKTKQQHNKDTMSQVDKLVYMIQERIPNSIECKNGFYLDVLKFGLVNKGFWFWKHKEWKQVVLFKITKIDKIIYITSYTPVVSEDMVKRIASYLKSEYKVIYEFNDINYIQTLNDIPVYEHDYWDEIDGY